jgi:hypothetical protein
MADEDALTLSLQRGLLAGASRGMASKLRSFEAMLLASAHNNSLLGQENSLLR